MTIKQQTKVSMQAENVFSDPGALQGASRATGDAPGSVPPPIPPGSDCEVVPRCRQSERKAHTASAGRNAPLSKPYDMRCCNHRQSSTSDLRPETFLTWRALTSSTVKPRASNNSNSGIQWPWASP